VTACALRVQTFTTTPTPLRALLYAHSVSSLAIGLAIVDFASATPLAFLSSRIAEARLHVALLQQLESILVARSVDIDPRHRCRYTGVQALDILVWGDQGKLSTARLADEFLVDLATVLRWRRLRRAAASDATSIGALHAPRPPLVRIADEIRETCRQLAEPHHAGRPGCRLVGCRTIAALFARVGTKLSKSSVYNFLQEPSLFALGATWPRPEAKTTLPSPFDDFINRLARHDHKSTPSGDGHSGSPQLDFARARPLHSKPMVKALLRAQSALGSLLTAALCQIQNLPDPIAQARRELADIDNTRQRVARKIMLIRARFRKKPPGHRPHCKPAVRAMILLCKNQFRLSTEETASACELAPSTISRWNAEVDVVDSPDGERALVDPEPPLASVRQAVARAASFRDLAAREARRLRAALARLCQHVPLPRTRNATAAPAASKEPRPKIKRKDKPIRAAYPNHYWMTDITDIAPFLRLTGFTFKIALVLDVFSRFPLAWGLFLQEPSAAQIKALLLRAIAQYGRPKHFVTDRGKQFTSHLFTAALRNRKIQHHKGAIGQSGSIAVIERYWLTLKDMLSLSPLGSPTMLAAELTRRTEAAILWYSQWRPHQALAGATPHERYTASPNPADAAARAPRGRKGDRLASLPYRIAFALEPEQRLPYLVKLAA